MKTIIYAILFVVVLSSCSKKEVEKTYFPEVITSNHTFNAQADRKDSTITFTLYRDSTAKVFGPNPKEWYQVKFGDTIVRIQTDKNDPLSSKGKFIRGKFLNAQKTTLLAQIADSAGLTARFYIIALQDHQLKVVELFRPSSGSTNKKLLGVIEVGRSGFLIDNDFFVSFVSPRVYLLKRPNPAVRIDGQFYIKSPDSQTFVFLMPSADLYQVNYQSEETYTVPLGMDATKAGIYDFISNNFNWQKNPKGAEFLIRNGNRLLDI
jgi:hypothetical protein